MRILNNIKPVIAIIVFLAICDLLFSAVNPDSLLTVYELRKNNYTDTEKAQVFTEIGSAYYQAQNFPEAIKFKKMACEIYHNTKNVDKEIDVLEEIGVLYSNISIYDQSLFFLLEALKIARKHRDIPREYALMLNIGTTHIEATNYENGIIYLKKCKDYYEKTDGDNDKYKFAVYTNLGVVYQHYNLLDTAQLYYLNALDICRKSQNMNLGGVLINIGDLYVLQDSLDLADEYYIQAMDHFYKSGDMRGYWHSKYGMARLSLRKKDFQNAISIYTELTVIFEDSQDLAYLSQTFMDLSELYDQLGDYKMSLNYFKKYSEINDKITSSEVLLQMLQFEMKYEIEILEQQTALDIELLKREKQLTQLKWFIVSGVLIIVLLIVIVFMTRHRIKKKLLESELKNSQLEHILLGEEIEFHKRELENFALNIVHKNNLLLSIKNELNELKDSPDSEKNSRVRNLTMQISQALKRNSDLEKLQERIDKVHFNFIQKLSENFPSLTEKEKRLCVMLKLDLSSKEIATLNDISEHAVMMARYRMRKKMNMNSEENLVDFLQKL